MTTQPPTVTEFHVGDIVTVGNGTKQWQITEFWTGADGVQLAALVAVTGYSRSSVATSRIRPTSDGGAR